MYIYIYIYYLQHTFLPANLWFVWLHTSYEKLVNKYFSLYIYRERQRDRESERKSEGEEGVKER